jgi:agmatinase
MSESANLPMNFGGIEEEEFSSFKAARVLVLPVSYEGTVSFGAGTGAGAMAIVDASRNMELYDEETDAEVYKIGIHTLEEFAPLETPEAMMNGLYERSKALLEKDKFLCMLGGEHSVSAPVVRAHAEKYHNLSVLQIDAHADLRDSYDGTPHSHASIMARVVKDLRIPSVQVGIRSISADEARSLDENLPTKIFWAKDIVGRTDWIDAAVNSLTENVYLTIGDAVEIVRFDSAQLNEQFRKTIMQRIKADEISTKTGYQLIEFYEKQADSYTYLSPNGDE